ncbi:bifunctional sugar phosphate isomerase/epimerase/4-hydroxyphenylpyruvate dioxygenase family protein [Rhizobium sp. TRM95796]|uniref:bifunctional sugar phosphate isomerase/epimerase/4-hydroxyphenylpyruvate dioxygenase family protein n=1 Tax=Rhizobium sp. TRM95796 TaxID=2979862 RepID=UPI0021E837AA|nr:sugar phosphate isomerase/epimerase and 4-hydroxyphenylpyruvate domain-containing protein [Rhizobium sp. TRM95796]MCV3768864.1 sugar phosphate isomerase/epimerase and 4-hydroxyphenylpyruvate domain-containing protein [Rhizobium sp. TRM95796]
MKTSIATVTLSGELDAKLRAIAAAGFHGVEIFENDLLAFDRTPREVGQMVHDQGLEITLFQPFRDFEGMPEPHRSRTFERAKRKFNVMQELGAELVLVCSNVSPISIGGLDRAAADFHQLGELAAEMGVRVGYEALAWGRHINDHRDAWEIVRRADHPNVGLILDSFHTLARKIDVNSIRSIPKEKIFIVQLADAPLFNMDLLYWSRHFRNMPGEGDLDVSGFTRAVAATGYDGYISLEIFNDQFRGGSTRTIATDGHRSLMHLVDQVRRAEPDIRLSMPAIPPPQDVHRIAFIEFAADAAESGALVDMLRTLGFRRTARHKSKQVDLYTLGDIRLVINTEEQGFAGAAFRLHGALAYAFGLEVGNAEEAMARAVALGSAPFVQPVADDEATVPAVQGPDGGIYYFLDHSLPLSDLWQREFETVEEDPEVVSTGLEQIDHIAQTVRYEDLLTMVLFYNSLFQVSKSPVVDIIDPSGIVRSQVVANASGTFRVTLNGAENRRTLAGHFLAESFGAAVQHVAFATKDIFATAENLARNGFRPLEINRNYYDDVEARFGLDPDFAERLRAANILYDRDEHGEYFQLYSPLYGEGFFFEVVERRGYQGYGAPNAIFRIAAQKRRIRPEGMPSR